MATSNPKIILDIPPYLRAYEDGTVERLLGTETTPPADPDPATGVSSKDVALSPESGVWARLYRPAGPLPGRLPLVVYYHGGAFCISSAADPFYHHMLNAFVREARVLLVSVDYRRAPESPLPAAYEDSWAALRWVAGRADDWVRDSADLGRVFLAGDSAGANICHHMAMRAGSEGPGLEIAGILLVHPYFWGEAAVGAEAESPAFKSVVDAWWRYVCPSDKGCDDPWINPLVDGAPGLDGLSCGRVLVCVAGNDILRERGRMYYRALVESGWAGKAQIHETDGAAHVFHIIEPDSEDTKKLIQKCAEFVNGV
ncbi:Probable carboxylesterase 2 [Striga hermonthica]|uniref:Probable carboxylesterase 2 n=1 Tax=Striga hermonthica TaxID=68872 RepID=A0A9N7R7Z2_STRHE|nr:Probable carboxylesterase 2 [Striga hermonthica]